MGRSLKKGPYVADHLVKKIEQLNESRERRMIKTWSRDSTVLPTMVGHTDRRAQREDAYPGVRHGKHGRA